MAFKNYCEYLDVDEKYRSTFDESSINDGCGWEDTYPHETFIALLNNTEKMLSGTTKKALWIHGAYGTGKSKCAYALKRILEVPEEELNAYWNSFDALKKQNGLLGKIMGHKEQGIITVYRYSSGSISNSNQLFVAVQESIKKALDDIPGSYKGENTLKDNVIKWLEDPIHSNFMNELLKRPKWSTRFSQSTSDEIINALRKFSDVTELMENIFDMSAEEGITSLSLSADSLCAWIKDVITNNDKKIVFVWDEFSDFFRQNHNSLSDFQKIVSLCQETHFYFVIVTHPVSTLSKSSVTTNDPISVVQQRFSLVEIALPPNIAFELTGHAISVIDAAKSQWEMLTGDLDARVSSSKKAVMKASDVKNDKVMKDMLPIQPMAALVLKDIASSFQSNQRSMFDFIKTSKDMDVKAFQWFIQNTSPDSDRPLLTVDMLWDFFYEKGKEYLAPNIRMVLDTFSQHQSLTDNEKIVLKTVLIMQAMDMNTNMNFGDEISIFKPTDQNLSYAFEGDDPELESNCKNLAKALYNKKVLTTTIANDGKTEAYAIALVAGDGDKLQKIIEEVEKESTIKKLVDNGAAIGGALNLTPALKLRYSSPDSGALNVVHVENFKKVMDALKTKDNSWHFNAVLAVAKNDDEASALRTIIKSAVEKEEYKNIAIIDALSTPLGAEEFGKYVKLSAYSQFYAGNNNQQSKKNAKDAKDVLEKTWKDKIHDGPFIVWTYDNKNGEKAMGAAAVQAILQTIVLTKYRHILDFTKGLTETQLKNTSAKAVARKAMGDVKVDGIIAGCDKSVLGKFWNKENYWEDDALSGESISIIKKDIDKLIAEGFKKDGRISIDSVFDRLITEYGFAPCNLTAFVVGFLLKEYKNDPYRSQDSDGHRDSMTPDKLSEMIGIYMSSKPKTTYIVSLTPEEMAFYELTEKCWGVPADSCNSPTVAGTKIQSKMHDFIYPVWTLEDVDTMGCYDIVKMYIDLIQSNGQDAHKEAIKIGQIYLNKPTLADNLSQLLTADNCMNGMSQFLEHFDDRKLMNLAEEIGAKSNVLTDIKKIFNAVEHSAQWNKSTGEDEIKKLTRDYEFVKITNEILNVNKNSKSDAFKAWREVLKFIGISCESIQDKYPHMKNIFEYLKKITSYDDILPDNMKLFLAELKSYSAEVKDIINNSAIIFTEVYSSYLKGLTDEDCNKVKNNISASNVDMFGLSKTSSNEKVKTAAEEYRKEQLKTQLEDLWKSKTDQSKSPKHWSQVNRTPILCCVDVLEYEEAKAAFETINSKHASDNEIKKAIDFVEKTDLFDKLKDKTYVDDCFMNKLVGDYSSMLPGITGIREELETLGIEHYDWYSNPKIKSKIREMACIDYDAGGSDKAINTINSMDADNLRKWLINLVSKDMELGIKIINGGK